MERTEIAAEHSYRCADCGLIFASESHAEKCPRCRCRVLIHLKGEPRAGKKCCSGSCAGCGGCSH